VKTCLSLILCWIVSASSIRVIDGDTFVASVDIWPGLTGTSIVRVLGVDTPEMRGDDAVKAQEARAFTTKWLDQSDSFTLTVGCAGRRSSDSFGRTLATVTRDGKNLADDLIAAGLGVKRDK